jgi:hypothetical protein
LCLIKYGNPKNLLSFFQGQAAAAAGQVLPVPAGAAATAAVVAAAIAVAVILADFPVVVVHQAVEVHRATGN